MNSNQSNILHFNPVIRFDNTLENLSGKLQFMKSRICYHLKLRVLPQAPSIFLILIHNTILLNFSSLSYTLPHSNLLSISQSQIKFALPPPLQHCLFPYFSLSSFVVYTCSPNCLLAYIQALKFRLCIWERTLYVHFFDTMSLNLI